jgi:hypothetical protein
MMCLVWLFWCGSSACMVERCCARLVFFASSVFRQCGNACVHVSCHWMRLASMSAIMQRIPASPTCSLHCSIGLCRCLGARHRVGRYAPVFLVCKHCVHRSLCTVACLFTAPSCSDCMRPLSVYQSRMLKVWACPICQRDLSSYVRARMQQGVLLLAWWRGHRPFLALCHAPSTPEGVVSHHLHLFCACRHWQGCWSVFVASRHALWCVVALEFICTASCSDQSLA